MSRTKSVRVLGHGLQLGLFLLAAYGAVQFLLDTVATRGWSPAALFGLLLVTGAVALTWRASLNFRKSVRRLRG